MVVASGVDFSKSVVAGEEFCFSEDRCASICLPEARSVSSCDQNSTLTDRDQR
jgi:hypothetical protein